MINSPPRVTYKKVVVFGDLLCLCTNISPDCTNAKFFTKLPLGEGEGSLKLTNKRDVEIRTGLCLVVVSGFGNLLWFHWFKCNQLFSSNTFQGFAGIESEWPIFFAYLALDGKILNIMIFIEAHLRCC